MTVSFRNNALDIWHQLAYLATKTVTGRLVLAIMLISPTVIPALLFFSTSAGPKTERFSVVFLFVFLGIMYAVVAFSILFAVHLAAWMMPEFTITPEPERFCMIYLRSSKIPWRSFQRVAEEPKFFCFLGRQRMVFIPKHAFTSRAEADTFYHTALTYWHEAKGTVPPPLPAPPDPSGVWPPAPRATDLQEPGRIGER